MLRPVIILTPFQGMHAAMAGVARNVSALRDGRALDPDRRDQGWEWHIVSCLAEYAWSIWMDIAWTPAVGRLDTYEGDVGRWQVKATTLQSGGMFVRKRDPADFDYVLGLVDGLKVEFAGWMNGVDAKDEQYFRRAGGGVLKDCYLVPQLELRDLEEVKVFA